MDQDRQNSLRRDAQNTEREQDFTTYRTAQSSNDMVPTVFRRGIYRTIRGSLKRFLSIVVITALGVSVMCGLKAGCEDLCDSVDAYFDQQNVYDINVQSTYGLTRDDLAAIQEVDGVETGPKLRNAVHQPFCLVCGRARHLGGDEFLRLRIDQNQIGVGAPDIHANKPRHSDDLSVRDRP